MADDDNIPQEVEDNIDRSLGERPGTSHRAKKAPRRQREMPIYKVLGDTKIPVAREHGTVWKSRWKAGMKCIEDIEKTWQQAIDYFENDQTKHRISDKHGSGNVVGNQELNNNITETENVVFANTVTMASALYARNPRVEFTVESEAMKPLATTVERLINVLLNKKVAPGVNIKKKAKRGIITALLTNRAWLCVNWISKDSSSEQALIELSKLAEKLQKAKDTKSIVEIEGQIQALEDTIDALKASGPELKFKLPTDVVIDPSASETDTSDAQWVIIMEYLPTNFLKAKYGKKVGDEYKSLFQPSHVLKLGEKKASEEEHEFSVYKESADHTDFGFEDDESFAKAQMTRVAFVWDKTTRRVYMYNTLDWTWPIWVWDDPLRLDRFFPAYALTFFESPAGINSKGEVSYYLDQQDAINEISDEERRARLWARRNVFFDRNRIDREDVEAVLKGPDGTARGVDVPEDKKIEDIIFSIAPPSIQFKELFDKESKYRAIDRISSTSEVLRGAQFKTNTTNDAVNANVASSNMRVEEKADEIEDWIGEVAWGLAQLCLMYMDQETVTSLIGTEASAAWRNMEPEEITATFSPRVVGGSSQKPTSRAKKQEAIEVGQVLGQFASVSPVVIIVALQMLQEAFDEVVIKEEDWQRIIDSINQPQQQASPSPQGPSSGPQQPQSPQDAQPNGAGDAIKELIRQLPPEARQELQQRIQQGEQPEAALKGVIEQITQ